CSGCGWVDEGLILADRTFHCQVCGLVLDRDVNAAINLSKLAGSLPDSLNACGEASADPRRKVQVKLSSQGGLRARKKQEADAICSTGING
ncbi:MAG TPA: zinc ribbon domain-containing protein, partial [Ktedonobacterales bacterium]